MNTNEMRFEVAKLMTAAITNNKETAQEAAIQLTVGVLEALLDIRDALKLIASRA